MDAIQLKLFIDSLTKGNTRKASDILDTVTLATEHEKGYKRALSGILSSVENEEASSLFFQMVSGALTKKRMEEHRKQSRKMAKDVFRPASERGYEKAWYDILSIFLGKKKVGLDKHVT
ncbi:MAG: hypothetical protein PVF58_16055 [Candidatus Methanofastidiosia archaeon]|jgi:hypothetical protein